jgi:hypothetical protein
VTSRNYNDEDLQTILRAFLEERQGSIEWLQDFPDMDWTVTFDAPFGAISAGDLFAAWVAHDVLHLRQMVELHWAWLVQELEPCSVQYAGEW